MGAKTLNNNGLNLEIQNYQRLIVERPLLQIAFTVLNSLKRFQIETSVKSQLISLKKLVTQLATIYSAKNKYF